MAPKENLLGKNFGRLIVIDHASNGKRPNGIERTRWKVQCSCKYKTIMIKFSDDLKSGRCNSCGCIRYPEKTLKDKILNYSKKNKNNCWIWQKAKDKNGYGIVENKRAHRASYQIFKGFLPKNMIICHTCDNPSCINPDHLFIGNAKDNVFDAIHKGRRKYNGKGNPNYRHGKYIKNQM